MLAMRIESVSEYLIHEDQVGFQKGRAIHNNLIDLVSILDYTQEEKIPALLVSFDFQKAFDNVNHRYLDKVLDFFGFGANITQMIHFAHEGAVSCTVNGGISSKYMDIKNGLRQGSPLSPTLFNLAVEVLAIFIRTNTGIKGIKIEGYEKKIGQYADDMWAVIQATSASYEALLNTFEEFANRSGLKLNYEKSQVILIGSLSNTNFLLENNKTLQWVNSTCILGVHIAADREWMVKTNYNELLSKIKSTLNPWKARSLTIMGKVVVINSLIMSKMVHRVLCVNSPDAKFLHTVKKVITDFLWEGKKAQIAYDTLIKSYEEGGVKLQDLATKNLSLKIKWVQKAFNEKNHRKPVWMQIANKMLPYTVPEIFECNLSTKDIFKLKIKKNWAITSILTWCEVNYHSPQTKKEILSQGLWMNSHIWVKDTPVLWKKFIAKGILEIKDIVDAQGIPLAYQDAVQSFGKFGNYMEYFGIIQNIPKQWYEKLKNNIVSDNNVHVE